ncbi:Uncharacterised protein [Klebsiella pneumoniae]|nr:Uncharacterised protein [Klebsiella pneumoniae]
MALAAMENSFTGVPQSEEHKLRVTALSKGML